MKLKVIGGLILLLSVIVVSCQSDEQQEYQRYFNGGKLIYQQRCQNCHGEKGEGLSALIPPLTDPVFLKKNRRKLACLVYNGSKATIVVVHGKAYEGTMPPNDIPPIDIAKVLTYVNNSFGNKQGVTLVSEVDKDLAGCK